MLAPWCQLIPGSRELGIRSFNSSFDSAAAPCHEPAPEKDRCAEGQAEHAVDRAEDVFQGTALRSRHGRSSSTSNRDYIQRDVATKRKLCTREIWHAELGEGLYLFNLSKAGDIQEPDEPWKIEACFVKIISILLAAVNCAKPRIVRGSKPPGMANKICCDDVDIWDRQK